MAIQQCPPHPLRPTYASVKLADPRGVTTSLDNHKAKVVQEGLAGLSPGTVSVTVLAIMSLSVTPWGQAVSARGPPVPSEYHCLLVLDFSCSVEGGKGLSVVPGSSWPSGSPRLTVAS